jgi:N-acetylglutamate synthase-like GNAT family acetyltransferase
MPALQIGHVAAGDPARLAELINAAYAIGEGSMWVEGTERVSAAQVADILREDGLLGAERDGRLVGCARVRRLDEETAELGLVAVAPDQWGNGVGGSLVAAAEAQARSLGALTIQLKLLAPVDASHPHKQQLRAWYERLGYRLTRAEPFEAAGLVTPCHFQYFEKPLR